MKRAVIIHGWEGGAPEVGWLPWLARKLEQDGWAVQVPAMPDTMHPEMEAWVGKLSAAVGRPDQETYLVGHSLGCATILRYLERLGGGEAAGGAVLVAGFASDLAAPGYAGQLASFFTTPLQWDAIKRHCKQFVAIHSDNDRWVAVEQMTTFKRELGAEGLLLHNMGHFSDDDGFTELPVVYERLMAMVSDRPQFDGFAV